MLCMALFSVQDSWRQWLNIGGVIISKYESANRVVIMKLLSSYFQVL